MQNILPITAQGTLLLLLIMLTVPTSKHSYTGSPPIAVTMPDTTMP